MKIEASCENCYNYVYDEEFEDYCCIVNADMDDYARMLTGKEVCPFFRYDNEYKTVNKQI